MEPMLYKLTIDINLLHREDPIPKMDTLVRWRSEGKVELVEADPPRVVVNEPPPQPYKANNWMRDPRQRIRPKKPASGAATFKSIAAVLFPNKDSLKLNMGEVNDVAHLVRHHTSKNEFFVTHNRKDFIDDGKRERLKASFGILAVTPDEAVQTLTTIEGWQ
jgi:hypothetical protein